MRIIKVIIFSLLIGLIVLMGCTSQSQKYDDLPYDTNYPKDLHVIPVDIPIRETMKMLNGFYGYLEFHNYTTYYDFEGNPIVYELIFSKGYNRKEKEFVRASSGARYYLAPAASHSENFQIRKFNKTIYKSDKEFNFEHILFAGLFNIFYKYKSEEGEVILFDIMRNISYTNEDYEKFKSDYLKMKSKSDFKINQYWEDVATEISSITKNQDIDLAIQEVSCSDTNIEFHDTEIKGIRICMNITNKGKDPTGKFRLERFINEDSSGAVILKSLDPHKSLIKSMLLSTEKWDSSGKKIAKRKIDYAIIMIDYYNTIYETNETNNILFFDFS